MTLADLAVRFLIVALALVGGTLVGIAVIRLAVFPAIEAFDAWIESLSNKTRRR